MKKQLAILTIICFFSLGLLAQFDYSGIPNSTVMQMSDFSKKKSYIISPVNIINVIPSPMQYIADIAFDGQNILAEGYNEYQIYKINPLDGSVVTTVPVDIKKPYGLAFNGTNMLVLDNTNKVVKEIDSDDGTIYNVYPLNFLQQSYPTGLAWTGTDFWYNDAIGPNAIEPGDQTLNFDNSGIAVNQFDAIGEYPSGMTFDGTFIWTVDNVELLIHQIDPATFTVIQSIEAPGGLFPNGLAWDGQYLWVANNDSDSLYQIDVGFTTDIVSNDNTNKFINIYPNPVINEVNIDLAVQSDINNIYIFSMNGKLVRELNINSSTWNCTDRNGNKVKPGIYFIYLIGEGTANREKIVIL